MTSKILCTISLAALILSLGSVAHAGSPSPLAIAIGEGPAQTVQSGVEKGYDRLRFSEEPNRTDTRVLDRSDSSSRTTSVTKTKESGTATTGPIQVNPVINLTVQNNSPVTVTTQAPTTGELVAVPVGVAVPVAPPLPVCRPAVIGNVGVDPAGLGRPVFISLRVAPTAAAPNVPGPTGEPVILPPGARIAICGGAGNWAQIQVCQPAPFPGQPPACVRGFVFGRYVLAL